MAHAPDAGSRRRKVPKKTLRKALRKSSKKGEVFLRRKGLGIE
jgi:hypothetical protein